MAGPDASGPQGGMAVIERRLLGATGLHVSSIGMGCAKLGAFWQGRSPKAGRQALDEARRSGVNFFDTADCYARGLSERILGSALRHHRDDVVICTKVGLLKTPLAIASAHRSGERRRIGMSELRGLARDGRAAQCFTPRYIERALERSLGRLRTDRVELLLLHSPSVEVIRAQAFLGALERLQASGKIRHFGVSCATEEEGRAALDLPGLACLQLPHNLSSAAVLPALVEEAGRRGVGLVAMAPFGDGQLLAAAPGLGLDADAIARSCLAFALSSPGVASVMVGMSTPEHVGANVRAAAAPPPPAAELESLRRALSSATAC